MQGEKEIGIKLHPNCGYSMLRSFINSKFRNCFSNSMINMFNCNKTLALHLHNGCQENILVHKKVNTNSCIENVSWAIVISNVKSKVFRTIVKVNSPTLGDCGKSVLHCITKHLERITLVIGCGITIHHKNINLTSIYNYYKISNKDIPSLAKQDQAIDCLQQWQQTKYDENDKQKMTKTLPNVPW